MKIDDKPRLETFELWHGEILGMQSIIHPGIDQYGIAFTGMISDSIIGAGGIVPLWEGVGHAWIVAGVLFRYYKLWAMRTVKSFLNDAFSSGVFHRIQTFTTSQEDHQRLAESFGFSFEGCLRKYGPHKEDYYMWARVK